MNSNKYVISYFVPLNIELTSFLAFLKTIFESKLNGIIILRTHTIQGKKNRVDWDSNQFCSIQARCRQTLYLINQTRARFSYSFVTRSIFRIYTSAEKYTFDSENIHTQNLTKLRIPHHCQIINRWTFVFDKPKKDRSVSSGLSRKYGQRDCSRYMFYL